MNISKRSASTISFSVALDISFCMHVIYCLYFNLSLSKIFQSLSDTLLLLSDLSQHFMCILLHDSQPVLHASELFAFGMNFSISCKGNARVCPPPQALWPCPVFFQQLLSFLHFVLIGDNFLVVQNRIKEVKVACSVHAYRTNC
ncbi:hypothetical protein V6N12_002650 [Hibiscus sabdariffa]|uniref:Uncharacterized protein n=1 Tax=Hibiscus sabdariffa TaxID=183260 RepID=A0ABR2EBP8_9ROSI